jgi:hypothetical protein
MLLKLKKKGVGRGSKGDWRQMLATDRKSGTICAWAHRFAKAVFTWGPKLKGKPADNSSGGNEFCICSDKLFVTDNA